MSRNRMRLLLLALILLAFTLRLYRLDDQELRGDEAFGYFFSLRTLPDIVQATLDLQEPHPVAAYYLQHVWLGLFATDVQNQPDHSEFVLRFPSAWFGLLAVALLYGLGRQLTYGSGAIVAALLLALSPYAIWHSQDARMYSMSLALTTASTWVMVLWLQRQRRRLAIAYVVISWLALHTHYFAVFILVAQNLFMVTRLSGRPRLWNTFVNWIILQGTVAFFYGSWLLQVQGILGNYTGNGDSPTLVAMLWRSLSVFAVGESTPLAQRIWWAGLAAALLFWGAIVLWRQGDSGRRALTLCGFYLAVPLLATWWSAQARPIFNERYLVAALPGFYLLVGVAFSVGTKVTLRTLPCQNRVYRLGSISLGTLLLIGMLSSLHQQYTNPAYSKTRGWRELAATLASWSDGLPTDAVRIAQNFPDPTLWYYYRGPVEHVVLPPAPLDIAGAERTVAALVDSGVQRVILPLQPAPNWDDGEIALHALNQGFSGIAEQQIGVWPVRLYSRQTAALNPLVVNFQNGLQMTGFHISPLALPTNGLLAIDLVWQGQVRPEEGLKVFVQLLNPQGQLVAQDDRGFVYDADTTKQPTHYGILLPAELPPGSYTLITGLYNSTTLGTPRVLTATGADFVELTTFLIEGNN